MSIALLGNDFSLPLNNIPIFQWPSQTGIKQFKLFSLSFFLSHFDLYDHMCI